MTFKFWNLWGTIIALATYNGKEFMASGKTQDEAIAKAYQSFLVTN